jgi:hypothetical protein
MNNRNLIILGLALVVMGALYWFSGQQRRGLDQSGGYVTLVEGPLSRDAVYGLEVYRGDDKENGFSIARRGDEWIMTSRYDAEASSSRMNTLLDNLEGLEGQVRSDDAAVLGDYGLTDDQALHVVLKDESGEETLHLLLGKPAAGGGFVRDEANNRVLLANRNLLSDFGIWGEDNVDPQPGNWLALDVFTPDRATVTGFVLNHDGKLIAAEKVFSEAEGDSASAPTPAEYEWRITEPQEFMAVKSRTDGILTTLTNMRARDVAPPPDSPEDYGLGEGCDRAEVIQQDGTHTVMLFGSDSGEDTGQFYFQLEGDDHYWLMGEYVRGNVFKSLDELKPN